jgi:hypothetical protein
MRGQVCRLQLLLALASAVILGSKSCGTRDHILLSQIRDFPFCYLLQLTGLWWRYSTPPPHRSMSIVCYFLRLYWGTGLAAVNTLHDAVSNFQLQGLHCGRISIYYTNPFAQYDKFYHDPTITQLCTLISIMYSS